MISKVVRGKTFYGACRYVCGNEKRAITLEAEGVRDYDYREMARDFEAQHSLRPSLGKPVFHGILSFYPGEKPADETMVRIARSYLKELGIRDTQYVITKHTDKDHLHLHILANMVNNKGETIKDNYIGVRGKKAAELITIGYHLREAKGKDISKINIGNLNEREAARYKIYNTITEQLPKSKTIEDFEEVLRRKGIETVYKYNGETDEKQGVSFSLGEYKFKGSEVDRNYSLGNLQKAWRHQRTTTKRQESFLPGNTSGTMTLQTEKKDIRTHGVTPAKKGILELLTDPLHPAELPAPSLLPKKRKKKKKGRSQ